MDGGIRVPTLVRWPGVVKAGTVIDVPTSMMDVLPTVASVIEARQPTDRIIDGVNILPLLRADANTRPPHQFLVHYCCENVHAARYTPGNGTQHCIQVSGVLAARPPAQNGKGKINLSTYRRDECCTPR